MQVLRSTLVLLAAFALGVSFVIPTEDLLDTAYDESEVPPYESTLPFSISQNESALAAKQEFPTRFQREVKRKILSEPSGRETHPSAIQSRSSITRFAVKGSTPLEHIACAAQACGAQLSIRPSIRTTTRSRFGSEESRKTYQGA